MTPRLAMSATCAALAVLQVPTTANAIPNTPFVTLAKVHSVGALASGGPDCNNNGVPDDEDPDQDLDTVPDDCDNCPANVNPEQIDLDNDGIGNLCDR